MGEAISYLLYICRGQVLVWDQDLISPMSLIADAPFMRKAGVLKMVRLPAPTLTESYPDAQEYIFLVRPNLSIVEMVVEAIRYMLKLLPIIWGHPFNYLLCHRTSKKKTDKKFTIAFTPHMAEHCISKLKVSSSELLAWH